MINKYFSYECALIKSPVFNKSVYTLSGILLCLNENYIPEKV